MWYPAGELEQADTATWQYTVRDKHFWPPDELTYNKNIKLIVDVGSNVGFSTGLLAAGWPESKVIGFEMDEQSVNQSRIYLSEFDDRVKIFHTVLGWPEREDQAVISTSNTVSSLKQYDFGQGYKDITVNIISFDNALKLAGIEKEYIDILKMDIEGAEWEIINDGGEWSNRVSIFVIETHSHHRPYQDFEDQIRSLGFKITFNHKGQLVGYK